MPAAVLCGAGLATLATFAAMGGFSRHTPAAALPVLAAKAAPVVVAPLNPVVETPAAPVEQAVSVEPAGALQVPNQAIAPAWNQKTAPVANLQAAPASNQDGAPAGNLKAAPVANLKPAPLLKAKAVPLPAVKPRAVTAAVPQAAYVHPSSLQSAPIQAAPLLAPAPVRPELKVSGIAWQNSGESSFAVVNGHAVLQGGMVDGFKVLEIRQDTVKFSGPDGNFEVPLGSDEK
jgi:general secretion pathway protein B